MSQEEQIMIETILIDADSWGLRYEVTEDAKRYLADNDTLDTVEAHIWAYEDWIK